MELILHKGSVFVEEIKEVELRSCCAQFICDTNYNRNAVMHLADFRSRSQDVCYSKEKSKAIFTDGYREKYHFLLFLRIHN